MYKPSTTEIVVGSSLLVVVSYLFYHQYMMQGEIKSLTEFVLERSPSCHSTSMQPQPVQQQQYGMPATAPSSSRPLPIYSQPGRPNGAPAPDIQNAVNNLRATYCMDENTVEDFFTDFQYDNGRR